VAPEFVAWRRLDVSSHCVANLAHPSHGVWIEADELVAGPRKPYALRMNLDLDPAWRTRSAWAQVIGPRAWTSLIIERVDDARWAVNGRRRSRLDGCVEIDIAASPLTNTMAIRHLGLAVGEEGTLRVAWIDVPSLRVTAEEQGYRRIGPVEDSPGLEAYEFWPVGGRSYRLTVDEDGLVVDYEDLAARMA
jgi:hypothetical protein